MQVYFDLEKKTLTTKSNNDIYEGSINANKLEVFVKVTDNTHKLYNSAFFSITALMSNGRKIGHFTHDGVINSTIIDGDYYNILTFTLTKENGYTLSAGILNVTLWLNVTDSNAQLVSREAVGNILINVKETTQVDDNILIVGASGETIYNFQTAIIAIQDSQNKLSLQLTNFGDRINNIEGKVIKNLGTISYYTDLNDILEVGYYIFSLYSESSGTTYLNIMEVESTDSYVLQTILKIGIDSPSIMKRTYTISSKAWTTSSDTFVMMSHIQDNLNSKSKQLPLSANQGRILNEKINKIQTESNSNASPIINLGTINDYNDLNDTLEVGYYIFKMLSNSGQTIHFYILEIEDTQFYTLQTIVCLGLDTPGFVKRIYWKATETWETSSVNMLLENGIIDNLNSTFSRFPLSANQGRILKENITEINTNVLNLDNRVKTLESNQGSGSNGGNAESVNLTKKTPIVSKLSLKEIYFDTSKTVAEVDNILKNLQLTYGEYIIFREENDFSILKVTFDDEYSISYKSDSDLIQLYTSSSGWDSKSIIDGKFTIPELPKEATGAYGELGTQNDILFDIVWAEEPIYIPTREKVELEDLNYELEDLEDAYTETDYYYFKNRCLDNKEFFFDLRNRFFSNEYSGFHLLLNNPKNCKISIIVDTTSEKLLSYITINQILNYVVNIDAHLSGVSFGIEGTRYPDAETYNLFTLYFEETVGNGDVNITIVFDNEGFATINVVDAFET